MHDVYKDIAEEVVDKRLEDTCEGELPKEWIRGRNVQPTRDMTSSPHRHPTHLPHYQSTFRARSSMSVHLGAGESSI